jgi:hypothetical protein
LTLPAFHDFIRSDKLSSDKSQLIVFHGSFPVASVQ